jgi:hypothetical protein
MVKKILIFTALAVAIMSFGGSTGKAHAATLSPAEAAVLSQQLDVAKATLINLEMNAGKVPQGDDSLAGTSVVATQPTVAVSQPAQVGTKLSAADAASYSATLDALATSLQGLNASISAHPNMTAAQTQGVVATLSGMQNTLVAMGNSITTSAPISAVSGGSRTTASAPAIAAAPAAQAPVAANQQTGSLAPAVAQQQAAPAPAQTAQAFSLVSFTKTHWPTIAIILLIVIMLVILFWPQSEEDEGSAPAVYASHPANIGAPAAPAPKITVMQQHQDQQKKKAA